MKLMTLAALTFLLAMPILEAQAQPNLTGLWKLNESKSDDPGAAMRQANGTGPNGGDRPGGKSGGMSGGGGRGGMGGGGRGGGMGSGGRGGQRGPSAPTSEETKKHLEQIKQQNSRLEIFQEGVELNITNGLDITQLLFTDGRPMTIWTQHGEAQATAVWQDKVLVIKWQTRQETTQRVRHYEISEDGQTLTATEERQLPGQDQATRIKLVYDRQS